MSTYFVGDVHGCYNNLRNMLDNVNFDPDYDRLYLTGDLVSRGPNSLEVLRFVRSFNKSAKTVLGNHDLHLLKTYFGLNYKKFKEYFHTILKAPDVDELMLWLRKQPILYVDETKKLLMSHAGINPQWNINQAKLYAKEIENILTSNNPYLLWKKLSNTSKSKTIKYDTDHDHIKNIQNNLNSFTKMRYIRKNGSLDFKHKDNPENVPKNFYPWFNLLKFTTPPIYNIIFGHWASLKNYQIPHGIYGLDSGCCWGGKLTILRWEDKKIIQIHCRPPF